MPADILMSGADRSFTAPVIYIYDDDARAANALRDAVVKNGGRAEVVEDRAALLEKARQLSSGLFSIDIDHGPGKSQEGLYVLTELQALAAADPLSNLLAIVLTSHPEFERRVGAKGADAFLLKSDTETDALELMTRALAHEVQRVDRSGQKLKKRLAAREYGVLNELWRKALEQAFDPRLISQVETKLHRALRWPFLTGEEQAVLGALLELFAIQQQADSHDSSAVELISAGFDLLSSLDTIESNEIERWLDTLFAAGYQPQMRWMDIDDE